MGTGASTESQGVRNDTPAPTQSELAQITSAILANQQQQQQQQAQYVPPQASIYTPPEQQLYTPPATQVYTPPAAQVATPGITALLPQDQGAQTLAPNTPIPTPLTLSEPQASIYTPPTQQVYTPPASQVYTPEARPEPRPEDKFFTTPDHPAATAPQPAAQPAAKAEEPAAKPAELTESQKQRNYWSNESEAFSRVMSGMESGKAQLKQVEIGADDMGFPVMGYALVDPENPFRGRLDLRPTDQPGLYQFSTPNDVAGGMIHGVVQADPKTGTYKPVQDYTKQVRYTPGQSGSVFGGLAGTFGDMFKELGPIAPVIANAIAPGLGSALSAVAALDEGNTTGALLSGLSAAGAYGGDAARNALAAEVSGNADLASQYSSGLGGALAQNLPEIKTATNALQLANAVESGNIGGALNAVGNLTGTQIAPEFRTGIAGLGLAQAIASGNVPQAMVLGSQFLPPAASGADVGPPAPPAGGISSLLPSTETPAEIPTSAQQVASTDTTAQNLGLTGLSEGAFPGTQGVSLTPAQQDAVNNINISSTDTTLPADTDAGLAQLVKAFTEPETTASYTGTQVADLTGTTGLPTDVPSEQDLEQLGVGLPALTDAFEQPAPDVSPEEPQFDVVQPPPDVYPKEFKPDDTTGGLDALAQQQAELERIANEEHERVLAEEAQDEQARPEVSPEEPPVDQVSPEEPVNTEVANDGTTGGIEDLIKTFPADLGDFEGIDMTGGGVETPIDVGDFEGIDMTGGGVETPIDVGDFEGVDMTGGGGETPTDLGEFEGIDMTGGGAGEPAGETDMDDFGDFEGVDMTGGGAGTPVDDFGDFEGIDMTGGGAGEPAKDDTGFEGIDMTGGGAGKTLGIFDQLSSATGLSPGLLQLLAGSLGLGGLGSLFGQQQQAPAPTPYTGPLSNVTFNPATYTPYTYKPYAGGGSVEGAYQDSQHIIPVGYPQNYPQTAPQMTAPMPNMAAGGIASLGGYSDGGRLLRGPGDGVSDSIPAVIGNKQPARLADGEFVVPARIVSELGNGSTEAGARQLYAMMDRIQAARRKTVGKDKVAANTKASKHLPA